jgi:hypothetical protein
VNRARSLGDVVSAAFRIFNECDKRLDRTFEVLRRPGSVEQVASVTLGRGFIDADSPDQAKPDGGTLGAALIRGLSAAEF